MGYLIFGHKFGQEKGLVIHLYCMKHAKHALDLGVSGVKLLYYTFGLPYAQTRPSAEYSHIHQYKLYMFLCIIKTDLILDSINYIISFLSIPISIAKSHIKV